MPFDELTIVSIVVVCLIGATAYYFYTRVTYLEKKISFLQNIVVELKQTSWNPIGAVATPDSWPPATETESPMANVVFENAEPLKANEVESLPEEEYYSNLLDAAAAATESTAVVEEIVEEEQGPSQPNYEAMSKQELTNLVKQRGLKANKNAKITELITILRRDDEMKRQTEPAPNAAPSSLDTAGELVENKLEDE